VLKVPNLFTNTRTQSSAPLSIAELNSLLDDSVVKGMPLYTTRRCRCVVDTVDPGAVDSSLQHAPDFVVDWIEIAYGLLS